MQELLLFVGRRFAGDSVKTKQVFRISRCVSLTKLADSLEEGRAVSK